MSEMGSSATEAGEAHMPMHVRFAPKAAIRSKSRDPPRRARRRHSAVFTRAMTAFAKSWRRDLLPLGGVRLLHLLHQRAFGFRQRLKCLVRRDRGNKLVIIPYPLGFRRLLHLIQMGTSNNTRFRRFLSWLSGRCSARAKVSPRSGTVLTPGWRPRGALRDAHGLHP